MAEVVDPDVLLEAGGPSMCHHFAPNGKRPQGVLVQKDKCTSEKADKKKAVATNKKDRKTKFAVL